MRARQKNEKEYTKKKEKDDTKSTHIYHHR